MTPESLPETQGQEYWRSLQEYAQTPEFQEQIVREFPAQAHLLDNPPTRRRFLTLMGASPALAGLAGCQTNPRDRIYPYVRPPEEVVPGNPLYFATAMPQAGYAQGLLVESHEGRPTKVEGNPDHPTGRKPAGVPEHAPMDRRIP